MTPKPPLKHALSALVATFLLQTVSWADLRQEAIESDLNSLECSMNSKIGKALDWKIFNAKEEDEAIKFAFEHDRADVYTRTSTVDGSLMGFAVPYYTVAVVSKSINCR